MSADQNLVSPDQPTTCTISGQVMHWDGIQWTHPSGKGCELKTHLSGDPVTATEMVELIAKTLWMNGFNDDDPWDDLLPDDCDKDEYLAKAHAVVEVLTEAGTVEWGTWYGDDDVDKEPSKEDAAYFASLVPDKRHVVSRLILPWERAE